MPHLDLAQPIVTLLAGVGVAATIVGLIVIVTTTLKQPQVTSLGLRKKGGHSDHPDLPKAA